MLDLEESDDPYVLRNNDNFQDNMTRWLWSSWIWPQLLLLHWAPWTLHATSVDAVEVMICIYNYFQSGHEAYMNLVYHTIKTNNLIYKTDESKNVIDVNKLKGFYRLGNSTITCESNALTVIHLQRLCSSTIWWRPDSFGTCRMFVSIILSDKCTH